MLQTEVIEMSFRFNVLYAKVALLHFFTFFEQLPFSFSLFYIGEIVFVAQLKSRFLQVTLVFMTYRRAILRLVSLFQSFYREAFYSYILIHFFHFGELGFRFAVGENNSVHHKLTVVRVIAEITSITFITFAIFCIMIDWLVYPIPNSTSTDVFATINRFPIIGEIAESIAHRVGIFGDMERVFDIQFTSSSFLYPRHWWILIRPHIHYIVVAFVLHGAAFINGFQVVVSYFEIVTRSCFITERPYYDRRRIVSRFNHFGYAGNVCIFPFFGVRERLLAVVILVRLYIGFIF